MTLDLPYPPGSRLCAYLRDSGHANQELSVPQQEAEIRAWCTERGYELPDELIFRDVAKTSKRGIVGREAFVSMTEYFAARPRAGGLLLWDFRRWGRDLESSLYWFLEIHMRGVKVYTVSEPIPEGPFGLIYVIIKLIGADEENKSKARDVRRMAGVQIRLATLAHILRNPVYMGSYRWGETERDDLYPPLVDPETWQRAQQAGDARERMGPRRAGSPWLLTSLLHCGACGHLMTVSSSRNVPHGKLFAYYTCPIDANPEHPICSPRRRLRVGDIDARVMARLKEIQTSPGALAQLHAQAREHARAEPVDDTAEQLAAVRRKIANITRAVEDGLYSDDLKRRQRELNDDADRLEKILRERPRVAVRAGVPEIIDAARLADAGADYWRAIETGDPRERQLYVRSIIERITVYADLSGKINLRELPGMGGLSGLEIDL